MRKIVESYTKLASLMKIHHDNQKIALVKGVYDLIHVGHLNSFLKAKSLGDILVVAVNSDEAVKRRKNKNRPIIPLEHRIMLLAAFECVDYVTVYEEETPVNLIKCLKPHVFAASQFKNFAEKDKIEIEKNTLLYTLPKEGNISTTTIIKKISNV